MYFATRLVVYHTSKVFVGHVGDRAAGCRWGLFESEEKCKKRVMQRAVGGGEGLHQEKRPALPRLGWC